MPRIDLFISRGCAASRVARAVIARFAARRADVEVHEWDLACDPGPARERGIFASPSLLFDGRRIFVGVPTTEQLDECIRSTEGTDGARRA